MSKYFLHCQLYGSSSLHESFIWNFFSFTSYSSSHGVAEHVWRTKRERERAFHLFSYFLFILVAFPPKFFSIFWMQIVLSFGEMPFYFQMVPLLFLLLIFFSFPFCLTHCFFSFKWARKGNRSLYFW